MLLLHADGNDHGWSIVSATTAAAAAAVSVMIASTCRLIAIAVVAIARAALVMMVMVALLLALQAHVRDDHLRVVAHAVVIAAASVKEQNLHQSLLLSLPVSLLSHLSRFSRERCMLSRRLSRERVMLGGSSVSLRRRALCELFFEADSCRFSHAWR